MDQMALERLGLERASGKWRLHMKEAFEAIMLRIYFGEADKWHSKPLHEAIVAVCQEVGMAGAIVYRGIEGYGGSSRIHHASFWKRSKDAPIMLSIIDTEEQIGKLIPRLDEMVEEGLVAISKVQVIRYSRNLGTPSSQA